MGIAKIFRFGPLTPKFSLYYGVSIKFSNYCIYSTCSFGCRFSLVQPQNIRQCLDESGRRYTWTWKRRQHAFNLFAHIDFRIYGCHCFVRYLCAHQASFFALLQPEGGVALPGHEEDYKMIMDKYGKTFRTFHHGIIHGIMTSLFLVLPIIGTNALYERKGFKYIAINVGYWMVSLAIMGGIISRYA